MKTERLLLFFTGINLLIIQFVMMREFSIVLFCTELVILLVSVSYFTGYVVGYFVSNRITKSLIIVLCFFTFLLHLHIPFFARYIAGYLAKLRLKELTVPALFLIGTFFISSFYTIFLPKFIAKESPDSLSKFYSTEILGSIVGLLIILTLGQINFQIVFFLYFVFLAAIAILLTKQKSIAFVVPIYLIAFFFYSPSLDKNSSEYFYKNFYRRWFKGKCEVVFTTHSPYQKIEVLKDKKGRKRLYLNGLEYFNATDLEYFNFYLSELPARLRNPSSVLIVGSGSMSSVYHVYKHAKEVTTVEIDKKVSDVGKKYFKEYNHLDEIDNWNLVIDDAKHFLSNTDKKFDLVIVDIPAPYYIQTALLFTREFYSMVKDRLAPDGVISIYLCERFSQKRKKFISSRIIAAINTVFDDFCIVSSRRAGYSFLMASEQFDFVKSKKRIADIIDSNNLDDSCRVLDKEKIMEVVADTKPSSFSNLDIVLNLNLWALPYDIDCR